MGRIIHAAQRAVDWAWLKRNNKTVQVPLKGHVARRNFKSASVGRLTEDWPTAVVSTDALIERNLRKLRGRSRWLYANNDYMRRFVGLLKSNVVGASGIRLQAASRGNDGMLDEAANQAIEKAFGDWGRRKNCDVEGRLSWLNQQLMFITELAVDGEYLGREIRGVGKYGYQLQSLDPELLDIQHNRRLTNGNYVRFSIEFDPTGRAVNYYLLNQNRASADYAFKGRKYTVIPASEIIHEFVPEWIQQRRGLPMAATAMLRLNMLGGYEETALTAARVGAANTGVYVRREDGGGGINMPGADIADGETANGDYLTDAEPGMFGFAPEGYDLKNFDPDYPHAQFSDFVKEMKRGASAGLLVSYASLANDLTDVNFSSIRQGVLEDREFYMLLQNFVAEVFNTRAFESWLPVALLTESIHVGGRPLPLDKVEKFLEHGWQPKRWSWVDPLKDAKAKEVEEASGWTSKSAIIRERGGDPAQVAREREKDQELFKQTVNPAAQEPGTSPGSLVDEDDKDD